MRRSLPLFIKIWFALDLALALLPPLHWAAGSGALIFGFPVVLVYFLGSSLFVSASVVAAYAFDVGLRRSGAR